jgi:hypothetical protein
MKRLKLYTAGYRNPVTGERLPPEEFYGGLPADAAVVDIRSNPYSPFAPDYTHKGVNAAVQRWKPGVKTFLHLRALGNTHRDASGRRASPPIYVDSDSGFPRLEEFLREHRAVVIFCACSSATYDSATHRCHRFFVAEEMARRMPGLQVVHLKDGTAGIRPTQAQYIPCHS